MAGGDGIGFGDDVPVTINAPLVVAEIIDGEAIIMHHGTGHYFDVSGSGALAWEAVQATTTAAAIAARWQAAYALDAGEARRAADAFLATLAAHDLIRTGDGVAGPTLSTAQVADAFAAPVLGVHADLADMLLLDPIHDVDEAGWPAARPAAHG